MMFSSSAGEELKVRVVKKGFTLAEVLIALVVIGIVAAITVPVVHNNVQKKVKAERVSNIRHKFSKATDAMLSTAGMNGYSSTMEFVQEFKRHFKISKVCDNNHIADCWPTKTVNTISSGEVSEWNIADTKTSENLVMPKALNTDWDDTVGIITNDGVGMILIYNKKCDKSISDGIHWNGDSSSSNTCVAAVFDWNGGKKPNSIGGAKNNDIYTINAGGLGDGCIIKLNGKCFTSAFSTSPVSSSSVLSELGVANPCVNESYHQNPGQSCVYRDYWSGAAEMCGHKNNLLSLGDLNALADLVYAKGESGNKIKDSNGKYIFNTEKLLALGIPQSSIDNGSFAVWTASEGGPAHAARHVYALDRWYTTYNGGRGSEPLALCRVK